METIREEYCTKHNKSENDLNPDDLKLIEAIFNLRQNYKKALHERKAVHFLRNIHSVNIMNYEPVPDIAPATAVVPSSSTTKCICKAFKKCGAPCTSPAKFGDFCGRHNPEK